MWIMIAGPYRSNSTDPRVWAERLNQLNAAAYEIFRKGHVPVIGVNMALPVIEAAGQDTCAEVMMPLSLSLAERCDAILRLDGASTGADQEVERFQRRGLPVYRNLHEVPM